MLGARNERKPSFLVGDSYFVPHQTESLISVDRDRPTGHSRWLQSTNTIDLANLLLKHPRSAFMNYPNGCIMSIDPAYSRNDSLRKHLTVSSFPIENTYECCFLR